MKVLPFVSLVGGSNPFETYARQIGSFPQIGVKLKNIHHHPDSFMKRFRSIVGMASSTIYPPTWGKGTSSTQQCLVGGDMFVPKRVPH